MFYVGVMVLSGKRSLKRDVRRGRPKDILVSNIKININRVIQRRSALQGKYILGDKKNVCVV